MDTLRSLEEASSKCGAVLLAAAICLSSAAVAQVGEPAAPPAETVTPTTPEVAPLEEQKIDQFADAYLAIEQIHADTAAQLEKTTDSEAANRVKAKAETQIIEAVEQSGLRLDEFNQIADLMTVNMELRKKIANRVQQRRKS